MNLAKKKPFNFSFFKVDSQNLKSNLVYLVYVTTRKKEEKKRKKSEFSVPNKSKYLGAPYSQTCACNPSVQSALITSALSVQIYLEQWVNQLLWGRLSTAAD